MFPTLYIRCRIESGGRYTTKNLLCTRYPGNLKTPRDSSPSPGRTQHTSGERTDHAGSAGQASTTDVQVPHRRSRRHGSRAARRSCDKLDWAHPRRNHASTSFNLQHQHVLSREVTRCIAELIFKRMSASLQFHLPTPSSPSYLRSAPRPPRAQPHRPRLPVPGSLEARKRPATAP